MSYLSIRPNLKFEGYWQLKQICAFLAALTNHPVSMTTGEPLIRLSEYGKSYTCLNSCRDEYYDRLQFRIRKRNSEYSHHPFLWDDLECLSSSTSNLSVHEDVEDIRKDVPIKTLSVSEDG